MHFFIVSFVLTTHASICKADHQIKSPSWPTVSVSMLEVRVQIAHIIEGLIVTERHFQCEQQNECSQVVQHKSICHVIKRV